MLFLGYVLENQALEALEKEMEIQMGGSHNSVKEMRLKIISST